MKPADALPHPKDWKTTTVRNAIQIKRGLSWSKDQERDSSYEGSVPVIGIGNVQDRLDLENLTYLIGLAPDDLAAKRATKGWTVLVGSNGNRQRVGNAVFISDDSEFLFASFLIAAKPTPDSAILPAYFYRWLTSAQVQSYLSASAEGSTGLNNLSHSFFRSMSIAFPAQEQQAAITRVLDAVDTAIERARYVILKAKELDHALLHELLTFGISGQSDTRTPPRQWETRRVGEVAEVGSGITLGKDVTGCKHRELPYLRVANVQDGHLDLKTIKTVKVRLDEVDQYRLAPGDVLMTEGGDLDKLGRGAVWDGQIPDCLHQNHIFRVRCDRTKVVPRYFAFVVESDIAKRYFLRVAKRTTNLASTNKTQVRAFRFPVPPLDEQARIVEVMLASKARVQALINKEAALTQLKKSLMHDLLTGTVRVTSRDLPPPP